MFIRTGSKNIDSNGWINVTEDQVIRPDGQPGIFGVVTMTDGSTILPLSDAGEITLVRDGAKRELAEELGPHAQTWTYLGSVDPFTTVVRSINHMFLAEDLTHGAPALEPGEVLAPIQVPLKVAVKMVLDGEITHAASCVSILKADRASGRPPLIAGGSVPELAPHHVGSRRP